MADIAKLRDELTADPLGRGYSGMTDRQAADSLNAKDRTRLRSSMSGDEVFQQTVPAEFGNLPDGTGNNNPDHQGQWLAFTGRGSIDPRASNNIEFVRFIFGTGSQTEANLAAARQETISRAEEVGIGRVTERDVVLARGEG